MESDDSLNLNLFWDTEAQKNTSTGNLGNKPEFQNYVDWLISIGAFENPSRELKCFKERFTLD